MQILGYNNADGIQLAKPTSPKKIRAQLGYGCLLCGGGYWQTKTRKESLSAKASNRFQSSCKFCNPRVCALALCVFVRCALCVALCVDDANRIHDLHWRLNHLRFIIPHFPPFLTIQHSHQGGFGGGGFFGGDFDLIYHLARRQRFQTPRQMLRIYPCHCAAHTNHRRQNFITLPCPANSPAMRCKIQFRPQSQCRLGGGDGFDNGLCSEKTTKSDISQTSSQHSGCE